MSKPDIKSIPPCFGNSIVKTFAVQIDMKAQVKTISMKRPESFPDHDIDCLSTVSMESGNLFGSLALGFPKNTLLAIVGKMLGETYTEVNKDNADGSGEMLNIIYSSARKDINEQGFDFKPALPTTVIGKNLAISNAHLQGTLLYYDCISDAGPFILILSLQMKQAAGQKAA